MKQVKELEVRPFSTRQEYEWMVDYFHQGDDLFLRGMGVDRVKLPERAAWLEALVIDHQQPDNRRDRFYLLWILDGRAVGHSSINKILPGNEAYVHLHLWIPHLRRGGLGTEFVRRSVRFYFQRFNLKKLVCEPFAGNPAPNRVLQKLGFEFVRRYKSIPTDIAFEQEVNRYELKRPESDRRAESRSVAC